MKALHFTASVVALLAPVLAAACASGGGTNPPPSPPPSAAATGGLTNAEIEAIFRARMDSATMRYTDADVRFVTDMIHHHAQALEMAALVPERTATASIRTLAARIINAQRDEIALMQTWLRDREQPVPEVHTMDGQVMVHGPGHGAGMVGMLTAEQMGQLAAANGQEFDRLFLTFMIQHHSGAVTMVHELFATDGAAQDEAVFKLASDVQVDQTTEIDRMERMLAALPGR
jgi:uncharacterized protein (DUF305 family)